MNPQQTQTFNTTGMGVPGNPMAFGGIQYSNPQTGAITTGSIVAPTTVPNTINAGTLNTVSPYTAPTVPITGYNSLIGSLQAGIQPLEQQAGQEKSALDEQLQDIIQSQNQLGNAGTEYANFLASPELKDQQKALADTNMQFTQARNAFQLLNQDTQSQPGSYTQFANALLSRNQQRQAITLGNLAAVSQTLQGNIDSAKATAKETIDAKYKPIEAQLEAKKFFYQENKDKFNSTQKRLADKQDKLLDIQLRKIQQDKEIAQHNSDNVLALLKDGNISGAQASAILSGKTSLVKELATQESAGKVPKGTTTQFQAAGYANRQEQANSVFEQLDPKIKELSFAKFSAMLATPSALQSPEMQQFSQATKNFINAQLRRESGAAISPTEFKNAIKQYIPAPGDSDEVLRLKEQNRLINQRNLINEAGTAYVPLGSTLTPVVTTPKNATGASLFRSILNTPIQPNQSTIYSPQAGFIIPAQTQ